MIEAGLCVRLLQIYFDLTVRFQLRVNNFCVIVKLKESNLSTISR